MAVAFALVFAAIGIAALWRFLRPARGGIELAAAAALIGVTGYVWQGEPGQAGVPVQSQARAVPPDPAAVVTRRLMTSNYGDAPLVANFADVLDRQGMTREAIIAVRTGIRKDPDNPELWVTMGNALVAHGGGMISPAAELAYQRAATLSPLHPAPPFFRGLALANSGRPGEAAELWRALRARAPADAPWRADVEARLAALGDVQATR